MKKMFCFVVFVIVLLLACPRFSLASFRSFKAQDITWKLIKHEIWADMDTYKIKGYWKRTAYSESGNWSPYPINYRIDVTGIYKPKELTFTENLRIQLMNAGYGPRDEIDLVLGGTVWLFDSRGGAGYDPWLWPSKANISGVSGQFSKQGRGYGSSNDQYASFDFPHPLSFYALTKAQRRDIRMEESEAILSPCPDMYNAPRIKSPSPGQLFEWKRLHMSFEVGCRYNDYRDNYFEVELQWYEPGQKQGANSTIRSKNGNFRPYPNQPTLVLDMRPAANQYEYKSWGSGHLDLPVEGRYRLRVRAQVAGEINGAPDGRTTNWSEWRHFVSGALKPQGGEALKKLPDAGGQ